MKAKTVYKCTNCNFETSKWQGKCPSCEAWNTFTEVIKTVSKDINPQFARISPSEIEPETLEQILKQSQNSQTRRQFNFSSPILNQFWNNGLTAGSLTLLAGEPGLGKSTLALQILRSLSTGSTGNTTTNIPTKK